MNPDFDSAYFLFVLLPVMSGVGLWLFVRRRRKRNAPAKWTAVLLGNVLFLLLLLTVLFAGAETYYRFIFDTTDSLSFTKTSQRWFTRYFQRNSAGWRDNVEYALPIEPGKRRITFIGDSFAVGHGVRSVEDRFPNRIRQARPGWEIHVLARVGLDTGEELGLIKKIAGAGYQFDQVVLVYNLNDVADTFAKQWPEAMERVLADVRQEGWLRKNSYFVNTIYHRIQVARNPIMSRYFDYTLEAYSGPQWDLQKQRLTTFRSLVEARGGRLLVVTFPFLHARPSNEFQSVHEQLGRFWREQNVPHLDLLSVYQDLPPAEITVNRYDAHPNEYAHQLAAERIAGFLSEQIGARRESEEPSGSRGSTNAP